MIIAALGTDMAPKGDILRAPARWSLHFEGSAPPEGFAGDDQACDDTDLNGSRIIDHGANLFDPAADEGEAV